jgi:predicted CXXCH cytochrome family protein
MLVVGVIDFNKVSLAAEKPLAEFVGSDQCLECHQQEYTDWRESDHHQAMLPADQGSVRGDFDDVKVVFHGIETRFFQDQDIFKVETADPDGKRGTFSVNYTFGHYPVQQYLVDIGNGHLQALNVAWDNRNAAEGGQRWYHLQADEDIDSEHPFFWTRHSQNANSRCIECHGTDVRKNYDAESKSYATRWSEVGIGCESCHGAASKHVALAKDKRLSETETGFGKKIQPRLAWAFRGNDDIASPSGDKDDSFIDTCGGCHSRRSSIGDIKPLAAYHDQYRLALLDQGLYFADGQIDDEVFVLGSFLQSKMHQKGVTCNNCHNPHSGKLIAEDNALCAQCHKPSAFDTQSHHHHLPGSTGALCANCHMPERIYMTVDPRRDHSFVIPDPWQASDNGAPNACINCHQDKTSQWAAVAMKNWGLDQKRNTWAQINQGLDQQDALVFRAYAQNPPYSGLSAIRQATLLGKLAAFPSRLAIETASAQLANPDPLIRRAAVSALAGLPLQLRWQLLNRLIDDPVKSIRLEVASHLADALPQIQGRDAERLGALIDEYRASLAFNADTPAGQLALGNLEQQLGYSILAEKAYRKALEIESHFVPALINLADLYRAIGSDGEARELLELALEVAPDNANANHAYGLYLVRAGQTKKALKYLQTAVYQPDTRPRHVYVYAVALDSRGQTAAAMELIEEQSQRWPNNLDLYFLQLAYMDKTGNTEDVHKYLSMLATVAANNPQVRGWMTKYGNRP